MTARTVSYTPGSVRAETLTVEVSNAAPSTTGPVQLTRVWSLSPLSVRYLSW